MSSLLPELKTLRDFIRYAVSQFNEAGLFFGHGTDNAWDEAIALVFHVLHLPHDIHLTVLDAALIEPEREKILSMIKKRTQERIPLPYLTHEAWFAGFSFYVDERVLIPRSPIAELIERQFTPWVDPDNVHDILDLCTGSGCIAIACSQYFENAEVVASDISEDALTVAKINVLRHGVEDKVNLFHSDLFATLPEKKYDIIISNPPYVDKIDMENLPKEYLHEPQSALAGGNQGLDFAMQILKQSVDYLNEDGIILIEVGNSEEALKNKYPDLPCTWLEFERGGGGVFLLTKSELDEIVHTL